MSHTGKESFQPEPMMSPMEFTDLGSNMTALIHGVVQTNLRTMLEFSRVQRSSSLCGLAAPIRSRILSGAPARRHDARERATVGPRFCITPKAAT
jgi:hypothetical protein